MPPASDPAPSASNAGLNWTAVWAVLAAVAIGVVAMAYWGDYRNATWLGLIGIGGALTARGRLMEAQGNPAAAAWWQRAGGVAYGVVFVWGAVVLVRSWLGG